MRVLYVTTYHRTGGWLAEAFAADSAVEVVLEESLGASAGLGRLRDDVFDAVLVSHEPGELDALEMVSAMRSSGSEEPVLVLGTQSEQEMAPLCFEVSADAYVCVNTTTTRNLIWLMARALERHRLIRDNRRMAQAERQRLRLEHHEAERLLGEQRSLVRDLEKLRAAQSDASLAPALEDEAAPESSVAQTSGCWGESLRPLPEALVEHYRQLLKAYIIMGSGNLAREMGGLAELFTSVGVTAPETMQLHLHVLEDMVRGLGTRSARHVISRADLLVLEVMVHLGEGYRKLYLERCQPPRQLDLPGFDTRAAA
jgi:DNA-binding response OmpR family regulator